MTYARAAWCALIFAIATLGCASDDPQPLVGLIVKTEDNPFFVTMISAAQQQAQAHDLRLRTYAGSDHDDWETQAEAIAELVDDGAAGILITPANPRLLRNAVAAARAAGLLVIALDTPFDPPDVVDAAFATDNFRAGNVIGQWVWETTRSHDHPLRIATLDGTDAQITLEVMRNQGFLAGVRVDLADPERLYDEHSDVLLGGRSAFGSYDGGRTAMAALIDEHPEINVVYAINEPAAAGAYDALDALDRAQSVLIVTIDGGCQGVRDVAAGKIAATAMQFPVRMAELGMQAMADFIDSGQRPTTSGSGFVDTGVTLVTDAAAAAIESISSEAALELCWG